MDNQYEEIINEVSQKRKNHLPIIALIFSFAPIPLWMLANINIIFVYLFFGSWWGAVFQFIGIIIGISALCMGKKRIGTTGIIYSIIAIIWPFLWWCLIWSLYRHGIIELFL